MISKPIASHLFTIFILVVVLADNYFLERRNDLINNMRSAAINNMRSAAFLHFQDIFTCK